MITQRNTTSTSVLLVPQLKVSLVASPKLTAKNTVPLKALPTVTTTPTPSTSQSTTQSQPLRKSKLKLLTMHSVQQDTSPTSSLMAILHRILTPLKQSSVKCTTQESVTDPSTTLLTATQSVASLASSPATAVHHVDASKMTFLSRDFAALLATSSAH